MLERELSACDERSVALPDLIRYAGADEQRQRCKSARGEKCNVRENRASSQCARAKNSSGYENTAGLEATISAV